MNSIPASALVSVQPGVLAAGGNPLSLNAVFLTSDPSIPIGTVQPFANLLAVQNWFGPSAPESVLAAVYFAGFTNSNKLPGTLWFAQFNGVSVAGYLRGGSLAGLTLTQLQAFTGTFTLSLDGVSTVTLAINLSGATSFSNAAALIQTGLQGGTPNNTATVTYDSLRQAFVVTSSTTGSSSSVTFAATGTLATNLKLTAAAGAVESAGAATAVPATLMNTIQGVTQNWATFMTVAEQMLSVKEAFAAWVQGTNDRYLYSCQDSDVTALTANATGSFGAIVNAAGDDGIMVVYDTTGGQLAAFQCAIAASIDFTETNGRTTWAFRGQAGLVPQITDLTSYNNLIGNGYNCYASFATANQQFQEFQPGQISGKFKWADAYINQIWLNSNFQLAGMVLLQQLKALPYNTRGQNLIRAAFADPINAGLNFGAIVPGVNLSASQVADLNNAAGLTIAPAVQQTGWYLQILPADPTTRANRGSPPMTFWYTDGGSIQKLALSSIDVQ